MDDRTTPYRDYVASLGRTICPCCRYATSYDRFFTCPLCDWAEPLAENAAWGVAASERRGLLTEARERYLTTGSALTQSDRATWAGELSRDQLALRKELKKRLEYLKDPERPDASETWAEVDALLIRLDEKAEQRRNEMPRPAPQPEVERHAEVTVHSPEPAHKPVPAVVTRPRELSGVARFAIYLVLIVSLALASIFIEQRSGVDRKLIIFGELGAVFLLASSGRPWWLYATVRTLGWFRAVETDRTLRRILAVLGVALVILAIVGR